MTQSFPHFLLFYRLNANALPQTLTIISDPHGCYRTFRQLVERVRAPSDRLIVVGDILDRGPDSYAVYRMVREQGIEMVLGNHEYMMWTHRQSLHHRRLWMLNGGDATLDSMEKHHPDPAVRERVIREMIDWCAHLPRYLHIPRPQAPDLLISHAGINAQVFADCHGNWQPCFSVALEADASFLWTRDPLAEIPGVIQVVGHTPVQQAPVRIGPNYYIDSGCVFTCPGMHYLTAVRFSIQEGDVPVEVFRERYQA